MSSLFGNLNAAQSTTSKPTLPTFSLTPATTSTTTAATGTAAPTQTNGFTFGSSILGGSTLNAGQSQLGASTTQSQTAIDLNHIRPTTKFDQLTKELQTEIERLDEAILNQIKTANEVPEALLKVDETGHTIPAAIELVSAKLDEVEAGLENDAAAIVALRDGDVKKGEGEAKCVFRAVDRLKVPRHYQVAHKQNESITGGVYGGSALSGWWNNPQTLRGSSRGAGGQTMQLPGEEVDDSGPKSLVDLFNGRSVDIGAAINTNKDLLGEIEDFVTGLEDKVRGKERQLAERLNYGGQNGETLSEKEQQEQLLKYVFGEVERGIFQTAAKVAGLRDDVLELTKAPR
ncbi:hypothetical protein DV735_g1526, partial [Chaetothyriales sp. CBS 134920]